MRASNTTVPCLAVLTLAILTASAASAGIYFESTSATRPEGKKKAQEIIVHSWVDGDKAKVLFIEGDKNSMTKSGTYLVTPDGGETLYLVNPNDKNYFQWNLDGMFASLGVLMQSMGPLFDFEFSDPKLEKVGEEAGSSLLGHSTRKVTTRTSFVMDARILGMRRHDTIVSTVESWIAGDLEDLGLGIWLRTKPPATGNEEFDKVLLLGWESTQGFPLKSHTTTVTTNKKGKSSTSIGTTEVTLLRDETVPPSTFEIPADFELIPMPLGGNDEEGGGRFGGLLRRKN